MAKLARVDRIVGQEPLADALKLPAPPTWVGVTPAHAIRRRPPPTRVTQNHQNRVKREIGLTDRYNSGLSGGHAPGRGRGGHQVTQVPVDGVGALQVRTVTARQLHQSHQVRRGVSDLAGQADRQQAALWLPTTRVGTVRPSRLRCWGPEYIGQHPHPAAAPGPRGGHEHVMDELGDCRIGIGAHHHRGGELAGRPVRSARGTGSEPMVLMMSPSNADAAGGERHGKQFQLVHEVTAGGRVDQGDRVGALGTEWR